LAGTVPGTVAPGTVRGTVAPGTYLAANEDNWLVSVFV